MEQTVLLKSRNFELVQETWTSRWGKHEETVTGLRVISKDLAYKHVVEIRLMSEGKENGRYKYSGVEEISHGMRCAKDSREETKEYISVLEEALTFSDVITPLVAEW